jgi:hypothetical protein
MDAEETGREGADTVQEPAVSGFCKVRSTSCPSSQHVTDY